jgi:hypothetical protein
MRGMASKTADTSPTPDRDAAIAALTEHWSRAFDSQDPAGTVDVVLAAAFPTK